MNINTYLSFNGQCDAALKFYEKALGAKIMFKLTYGEAPVAMECTPNAQKLIMHARFTIDGHVIMCSDAPADRYNKPQGFHVSINIEQPAEAERIFKALSENATVQMPLEETFWAQRFGMLIDQFGTPWMINCEKKR